MRFVSSFGMLSVRSFDTSDLSIDCLRTWFVFVGKHLDRLRLGVSPGETSEVFGQ